MFFRTEDAMVGGASRALTNAIKLWVWEINRPAPEGLKAKIYTHTWSKGSGLAGGVGTNMVVDDFVAVVWYGNLCAISDAVGNGYAANRVDDHEAVAAMMDCNPWTVSEFNSYRSDRHGL